MTTILLEKDNDLNDTAIPIQPESDTQPMMSSTEKKYSLRSIIFKQDEPIHAPPRPQSDELCTAEMIEYFWCKGLTILVFYLGLGITLVTIGQTADASCQQSNYTNELTLSTWLTVVGASDVVLWALRTINWLQIGCVNQKCLLEFTKQITNRLVNAWICFQVAWIIWAIVVLARSYGSCVRDNTVLGITTVFALIIQFYLIMIQQRQLIWIR